jgi:hypothetical protein
MHLANSRGVPVDTIVGQLPMASNVWRGLSATEHANNAAGPGWSW